MNRDHISRPSHSETLNSKQAISSRLHPALGAHCDKVACCEGDHVSIRGFRIHVREIESAVEHMLGVKQCTTAVWKDGRGDEQLIAYVVGDHQAPPSTTELRRMLKPSLPNYMVPSVFIAVEFLPLTPSGEVDRTALPAPQPALLAYGEVFVGPGTPTEELLAEIWSDALGVTLVGINDNFFELGGHPLLVNQVVSHMSQTLQLKLSVQTLFEFQTIAELAPVVEAMLLDRQRGSDESYDRAQWCSSPWHN